MQSPSVFVWCTLRIACYSWVVRRVLPRSDCVHNRDEAQAVRPGSVVLCCMMLSVGACMVVCRPSQRVCCVRFVQGVLEAKFNVRSIATVSHAVAKSFVALQTDIAPCAGD